MMTETDDKDPVAGRRFLLAKFLVLLDDDAKLAQAAGQVDETLELPPAGPAHGFDANLRPGLRTNANDSSAAWVNQ